MWAKVFSLLFFLFLSCTPIERYGKGKDREVILVVDGAKEEAKLLKEFLGESYRTPQLEHLFQVYPMTAEQFKGYRGYKNVIILTHYASESYSLFQEVFGKREAGIYETRNALGEGDFVLGILAPEATSLRLAVEAKKERIKTLLLERVLARYEKKVYFAGRNERLRQKVLKRYGFTLDFPAGFATVVEDSHFVAWAKHYPDQFIFVYFENFPRPLDLSLLDLRDKLGAQYYEGDRIDREEIKVEETKFLEVPALKVQGIWQNEAQVRGGPFAFIAFNLDNRFYLIDRGVFAPDKRNKLEYLMRLEIITKSFTIPEL